MSKPPKRIYAGMPWPDSHYTVVKRMPDDNKTRSPNLRKRVRVRCVCGSEEVLPVYYLTRKGPKTHCGCRNKGIATLHPFEYRVWYMMNVRCSVPTHRSYKDYGGRGIFVCERWHKSNAHGFANFLHDMGKRPSLRFTLDRIDVNGPYAPEWDGKRQCKWATWEEQNNNKRSHLLPPPEEDEEVMKEVESAIAATEKKTQAKLKEQQVALDTLDTLAETEAEEVKIDTSVIHHE